MKALVALIVLCLVLVACKPSVTGGTVINTPDEQIKATEPIEIAPTPTNTKPKPTGNELCSISGADARKLKVDGLVLAAVCDVSGGGTTLITKDNLGRLFLQVTTAEPTKVRAIIQDYKGEITNTFEINGKSQVQGWIPPDYIYQIQSESSVELIGLPPTRLS